ncbi:MAG: cadherin-like domain-containing protein, partial [Bacteroidetes bacterium]|nr:cadherin-like domain-containing protein [Bacteroidota bacterium]
QVQSVCTESVNGGTIVTNNDGTYTYYPPAGVNFLATDSFCYTIIDAYGYTATANVILYFYNNNGQDPIIDVMAVCINCDDSFFGTFNLYITVIGSCEEGYTWVNNLNPDDGGEVNYDAGVGAIYLTNMSSENGYDITVSNKCTGETATVASMVNCPSSFSWSDFITMVVDYAAEIVISEEYLNDVLMNMGIWYPIIEEYCTASENGGTFTDNGDGTYLYTAPLGVDSLLSDRICLSIYSEFYTYEVYLELVFANMQDPQIETNLLCCYYGGVYLKVLVKGVCEEGYTWVNNTLTEIEEIYTSNTYYSEDILLKIDESEGYNLTFTNNCTGESVTIAETDISANCYAGITANYDQLFSINYSPVTFSADTLLANDSYYNLSISSIDNTSAQGGTIVNNGDGTFTYYPPATVTSTTDIFTYTVVNASGTSTATANVVVSFIAADPIVAVSPDCQTEIIDGQEVSNGLYDLTLTLNGTCQAGYTWQNNNNSSESGEALPDSTGTAVIVLPNQSLTDNETYNITITNNCTGAAQTIAEIVNCTDPTAVDLLRFSGEVKDNGNLLSWVSASEKDNAYYTVESSRDGQNFTDIAQIAGAGTSSSAKQYQFLDANAGAGTTYYRLSWTEQSGTRHKHPSTVLLHRNGQNTNIIAVYPIPINDMLHLNYTSKIAGEINLKIYDILGRMVYEQELQTKVAINKVEIDMKQFPSGTYFLILSDGSEQTSTKFIKD